MGRLVKLWKHRETASEIEYLYGPRREEAGLLTASKAGKGVTRLRGVQGSGDQDHDFLFFELASFKVTMLCQLGDFPDETYTGHKEYSPPSGPTQLLEYFEWVADEYGQPHWRRGAEMCRWWLALIAGSTTQADIDRFIAALEAEPDPGTGWLDLSAQFRTWARTQGFATLSL